DRAGEQSTLQHCRIERASNSGLRIDDTVVDLEHCEIRDNRTPGNGGGIAASLTDGDLVLRDCRIVNNAAEQDGGGIYAAMGGGNVHLDRCTVRDNRANPADVERDSSGGGLHVTGGNGVAMRDSEVTGNLCNSYGNVLLGSVVAAGGGIYCGNAESVTLTDTLVADNRCTGHSDACFAFSCARGAGLAIEGSAATLTRCLFRDNHGVAFEISGGYGGCARETAASWGGGVYWHDTSTLRSDNCVFAGNALDARANFATAYGGGLYAGGGGHLVMANCTVADSDVFVGGPPISHFDTRAVHVEFGSSATIANTIAWNNEGISPSSPSVSSSASVTFSDIEGGYPGAGNLDVDPKFRGPAGPTSCGAAEITAASPCVDAGNPNPLFDDTAFPPSFGTRRNDMGANGGPLAGGWVNWARATPTLTVTPPRTACPGATTLELLTSGGSLARPVAVFLEAVNGQPLPSGPAWLPPLGQFCSAGRWELHLALPAGTCGVGTLTFRSYALDARGALVASNTAAW
ncbi:MAG: right-handed parallel beta-helix repeat-containing protein, partial [Planctomycetota bacterium]